MIVDEWTGCYPSSWRGIITPESFSHPAKASNKLAERIYKHAIAEGWLHEGSRIVDPFGGIGGFAFHAMLNGMDMTLVELEPRFVALAQANIDAWNAKYRGRLARWGTARIHQGDSRHLAQVIGAAEACISSPPYAVDVVKDRSGELEQARLVSKGLGNHPHGLIGGNHPFEAYGSTPGNLGNMRPGDVDACISSPPYAEVINSQSNGIDWNKAGRPDRTKPSPNRISPGVDAGLEYGQTPGQLASLPPGAFEAAISSPPFEDNDNRGNREAFDKLQAAIVRDGNGHGGKLGPSIGNDYGSSSGQLGNDSGETFWSAAREIVAQVYAVLAPGAHAVWVVKSYVKNKALVDFPHQWQALCEACGFVTLHEHHALLVRHNGTSIDIDGNHHEHKTESKSFFRRLAEKNGSPRIDYETVLCQVKPGGSGGGWDGAISSPPYSGEMNQARSGSGIDWTKGPNGRDFTKEPGHRNRLEFEKQDYGSTPGQLGSLPPGSLDDALENRHGEGG